MQMPCLGVLSGMHQFGKAALHGFGAPCGACCIDLVRLHPKPMRYALAFKQLCGMSWLAQGLQR
jgi:hypothetical protein